MSGKRGYLIDTNVISELIRDTPNPSVMRWLSDRTPDSLYLSVITLGELVHGVARLAKGARRDRLQQWLQVDIQNQFAGRLLGFGEPEGLPGGISKPQRTNRVGHEAPSICNSPQPRKWRARR